MSEKGLSTNFSWRKITAVLFIIIFTGFAYSYLTGIDKHENNAFKAAIVDGLKGFPNPYFIEEVTEMLSSAGFSVDYYGFEDVTVKLYNRLPSKGYTLIILRVHCGPLLQTLPNGTSIASDSIVLFTTEEYNQMDYRNYQRKGVLARGRIINEKKLYFAIPPPFVSDSMQGDFKNTTIILDSCHGLYGNSMAQAFINKGVSTYIGWDGEVSANHTDEACLYILKKCYIEGLQIREIIEDINPDPIYGSYIKFYTS